MKSKGNYVITYEFEERNFKVTGVEGERGKLQFITQLRTQSVTQQEDGSTEHNVVKVKTCTAGELGRKCGRPKERNALHPGHHFLQGCKKGDDTSCSNRNLLPYI